MRYRKLDASGDMVFGHQQADFWRDVPDAPAQAVWTRLQLYLGDWYLNLSDGTPWRTQVLGKYTGSTRDPAIQARTLGTLDVTGIHAYASQVNPNTRQFNVQMTIDTSFGRAYVNVQLREPT
jgi:hypothetical protein